MDMITLDQKEVQVYSLYFLLTFISHGDMQEKQKMCHSERKPPIISNLNHKI